ncbi:sensor histidine kinase [Humibacter antri]
MSTQSDTMTTHSTATVASGSRPGFWAHYGELWKRTPTTVAVLFVSFPLAVIGISLLSPLFFTGVGMAILIVGFFLVLAALFIARGYGALTLTLLEITGMPRIPRPRWRGRVGTGFIGRVFFPLADPHYWLYLLDAMLVQIAVSTVTWGIMIAWVSTSIGGATYWLWGGFIPTGGKSVWVSQVVWEWATGTAATFDPLRGDMLLFGVAGVIFLFTLPWVMRGLIAVHWSVAKALLGALPTDELRREVSDLSTSRAAAVAAEDRTLRQLERDIHDGPQQQLIRLRMDLAAAGRRMTDDPDASARLIDEAGLRAQDALDELRALSRGFAPPILQDRGLAAALESLGSRSMVPVTIRNAVPAAVALPPEVERNVYFVAAELLTNVAKHSGAVHATLDLALNGGALVLTVSDDGSGGAGEAPGHGLAGIRERMTAMRGTTSIASGPAGTTVSVAVPLS